MKIPLLNNNPKILIPDLTSETTTALVTIPDGLACAPLVGVNPVHGLYSLMVGTPIAALTLSSQFMYIANPGTVTVAGGDALGFYIDIEQQVIVLVTLMQIGLSNICNGYQNYYQKE